MLFFLEKKQNKKQTQNAPKRTISVRLAEIYQRPLNIQDIGDAVIYSPYLDNSIKSVFLVWYEMKLASIKGLDEITSIVIGD